MADWQTSLQMLVNEIPPPVQPRYTDGPLLDPSLPEMPDDHTALIRTYGSGEFVYGDIGCVVEIFNPRDPWHMRFFRESYEILRDYRRTVGDKCMPFPIFPERPGVLICGNNDSRDYWFWYVNSTDPNKWPTVFYGDLQDSYQFEMPMVVFMQKLFFGEISRRQLNFAEPDFAPAGFEFQPARRTGAPDDFQKS